MMAKRIHQMLGFLTAGVLATMALQYGSGAEERPVAGPAAAAKAVPALVGTWRVSFSRPPARGLALVTFTSDGTSVRTTDRSPFMSASHGAWQQLGEREFQATWHAFQFDAKGAHSGNQKAVFRVTISADGNSLTGVGMGTTQNLDGTPRESETAVGPFEGTRVIVEPYNG
jgi:hypothetical protein